jgi:DNA repair exonuclease SbcCD ATPase subunit
MADEVELLDEDKSLLDGLRQTISGMKQEAQKIEEIQDNINNELKMLEGKINSTLELVEEAEKRADWLENKDEFRRRQKKWKDEDSAYTASITEEDFKEYDEEVKQRIQEIAKLVREAEQNTKDITDIADDAENKVKQELRDLASLSEADSKVAEIERRLEQINDGLPAWNG